MTNVLIAVIVLETLFLFGILFTFFKSKKSRGQIMTKAEQIVKGKLDVEDIRVGGGDNSSNVMASAFNSIKSNLLTFVESTKNNVVVLSDAIDTLSKSVDANQSGNEQIADGVSSVAVKAGLQLDLVKDNLEIIEANNIQMNEIEDSMDKIKTILDNTVDITKDGLSSLEGYEHEMNDISDDLTRINGILTEFNDEIKRIEEVGDFIISISEQLRLLAFNASIEAARAGQAGKGFAVVADEMNEMSIKTKEGMGTINQIVKEIIDSSRQVNAGIKNCEDTFNDSKTAFNAVNKSFRLINQQAFDIHDRMQDISDKFGVISDNSNLSKEKASDLYDASVSISESTHEIAAASEETAAESAQIGANVENLGGMLLGIQNLLKQFSTAVVPVEKDRNKKVKIAAFSMLDNDFWYGVRRGIMYAQKELGNRNVEVRYVVCGGEDLDAMVRDAVNQCIEDKFDAIIFPGFLGGANEEFKRAASMGIKIVAYNCDCNPEIKRVACFSPDAKDAGALAAKATAKYLGKSGGKVAMLHADMKVNVNKERKESYEEALTEFKNIRISVVEEVQDDEEDTYKKAVKVIKNNPGIDVIYLTNGMVPSVIRAIHDTASVGKIAMVSFDHNAEIYANIKKGVIASAIGQDPFGQGHDPIVWIYNHIVAGQQFPDEYMKCRLSVVDKDNVDTLVDA